MTEPKFTDRNQKRLNNKKRKAQAFLDLIKSQNGVTVASASSQSDKISKDPEAASQSNKPDAVGGNEGHSLSKKRKTGGITKGGLTKKSNEHKKFEDTDEDTDDDEKNEKGSQNKPQAKVIPIVDVTKENKSTKQEEEEIDDVLAEKRKILRERQKAAMKRPKVFLTLDELTRESPTDSPDEVRETPPLVMLDVQHLLLLGLLQNKASIAPRWCRLLRMGKVSKVVAVVLDSVSGEELTSYPESVPTLRQAFDMEANIIPPAQYGSSVREDLLNVQITTTQLKKAISKLNTKKYQLSGREEKEVRKELKTLVRMRQGAGGGDEETVTSDRFDRTSLMLNSSQILQESIPMPFGSKQKQYHDFVFSKDKYTDVTEKSPMFGIDCEMVQSVSSMMDLARVSLVDENFETLYDTYVKPRARIKNYVTRFSGITKEIMDNCDTYLEDVQEHLQKVLPPDAILCGQSIGGDLRSLKMFHPYIVDTSVIYNLTGKRHMKTGLKRLTAHFFSQNIQEGNQGHSSVEDAIATMQLVKLKLDNGIEFGDLSWSIADPEHPLHPAKNSDNNSGGDKSTEKSSGSVRGKDQNAAMSKSKLFWQRNQNTEFFLNYICRGYRKGVLVDEPGSKQYYPESDGLVYLDTDQQRQRETVECLEEKDFCLSHFYAFRDHLNTTSKETEDSKVEAKKNCLRKLDKTVGEIMTEIPANSLFVVLLTSGQGRSDQSAKVLCKITGPLET